MPDGELGFPIRYPCLYVTLANKNLALNSIIGAAFGAAGQRCMAISVAVFVGDSRSWVPELVERANAHKVNGGFEAGADLYV